MTGILLIRMNIFHNSSCEKSSIITDWILVPASCSEIEHLFCHLQEPYSLKNYAMI